MKELICRAIYKALISSSDFSQETFDSAATIYVSFDDLSDFCNTLESDLSEADTVLSNSMIKTSISENMMSFDFTEMLRRLGVEAKGLKEVAFTKYIDAAEKDGWTVSIDKNGIDFRKYSPAGEDFSLYVNTQDPEELYSDLSDRYLDFDEDEHVRTLISAKDSGLAGVPSIKVLAEDAEEISKMIKELLEAINAVE